MTQSGIVRLKKILKLTLLGLVIASTIVTAFYLAQFVYSNNTAQEIVGQFSYLGVLVIAVVAGLNAVVPIPAATFVPIFLAAGLWMPIIVLMLVIGTTIADLIGYFIGRVSREFVEGQYPKTYARVLLINEKHHRLMIPLVFIYSAFIPFPNEAMLIPAALVGLKLRVLIVPLVLGTLVNQVILAYGFSEVFGFLFG